jgi:hypothetical protein
VASLGRPAKPGFPERRPGQTGCSLLIPGEPGVRRQVELLVVERVPPRLMARLHGDLERQHPVWPGLPVAATARRQTWRNSRDSSERRAAWKSGAATGIQNGSGRCGWGLLLSFSEEQVHDLLPRFSGVTTPFVRNPNKGTTRPRCRAATSTRRRPLRQVGDHLGNRLVAVFRPLLYSVPWPTKTFLRWP